MANALAVIAGVLSTGTSTPSSKPSQKKNADSVTLFSQGRYQARQANNGLIGKLHITSEMDDNDVTQDICSVFKHIMRKDPPAYWRRL